MIPPLRKIVQTRFSHVARSNQRRVVEEILECGHLGGMKWEGDAFPKRRRCWNCARRSPAPPEGT